jgi:hypothetical protein
MAYKKGFVTLIWKVKNKNSNPLCAVGPINFLYTILFKVLWPVKPLMGIGQKLTLKNYKSNE